jgi:CRISPR-associated protein Cmr3
MSTYELTPIDPLVIGDGRPFGSEPGSQSAGGLDLPTPATVAGALRSEHARQHGKPDDWSKVLDLRCKGPVLMSEGQAIFPAPGDFVLAEDELKRLHVLRSRPGRMEDGCGANLPDHFVPVTIPRNDLLPTKKSGPRWLSLNQLVDWYLDRELFGAKVDSGSRLLSDEAVFAKANFIQKQERVHVGIDHSVLANQHGAVFTTTGTVYQHGVSLAVDFDSRLDNSVLPLAGERRLSALKSSSATAFSCPDALRNELARSTKIAMYIATPAYFEEGSFPTQFQQYLGEGATLVGAVCRRREAISGWDLVSRSPKSARWCVPAGSVYYFELDQARPALVDAWMTSVSEDDQLAKDGFGLAMFFPTSW